VSGFVFVRLLVLVLGLVLGAERDHENDNEHASAIGLDDRLIGARQHVLCDSSRIMQRNRAQQLHDLIDQVLTSPVPHHGTLSDKLESVAKSAAQVAWRAMKRHPFLSIAAIAVGGVALAAELGVAELVFGSALALGAYKVLREGEPLFVALEEVEREVRRS
jgi:hypothetical protein